MENVKDKGLKPYVLTIRNTINRYVPDPRGQRIISSGIKGVTGGLVAGTVGGFIEGSVLFGAGALPWAVIGGLSGTFSGFAGGLLSGVAHEMLDVEGMKTLLKYYLEKAYLDASAPCPISYPNLPRGSH